MWALRRGDAALPSTLDQAVGVAAANAGEDRPDRRPDGHAIGQGGSRTRASCQRQNGSDRGLRETRPRVVSGWGASPAPRAKRGQPGSDDVQEE